VPSRLPMSHRSAWFTRRSAWLLAAAFVSPLSCGGSGDAESRWQEGLAACEAGDHGAARASFRRAAGYAAWAGDHALEFECRFQASVCAAHDGAGVRAAREFETLLGARFRRAEFAHFARLAEQLVGSEQWEGAVLVLELAADHHPDRLRELIWIANQVLEFRPGVFDARLRRLGFPTD